MSANSNTAAANAPKSFGPESLVCVGCGAAVTQAAPDFRCAQCHNLLEVVYAGINAGAAPHAEALRSRWRERKPSRRALDRSGVWRFRELLPAIGEADVVTMEEGNTPLYELPRCAQSAGVDKLLAKHQGMNPTGSFKDTGMTVALSAARQQGFQWVGCASTGNTSASMAAYAARAGMQALVLIPDGKIAWGKLSQSLDYGACTLQLKTDFDGCLRTLEEVVQRFAVYLLNSLNPYRIEGQKTAAIELLEQLDWQVPDHIIVPGGNLGNSSALGKALRELHALGVIDRVPKLSIIQAAGANPLVRSMREHGGASIEAQTAETRATAIRIGNPASWKKAVRVLQETGGACDDVTEGEIALAKAEIGADGIGCEPASAVTLAGLKKLVERGFVRRHESVVLLLTGHTLKDPDYTLDFHRGSIELPAAPEGLRKPPRVLEADAEKVIRVLREGVR